MSNKENTTNQENIEHIDLIEIFGSLRGKILTHISDKNVLESIEQDLDCIRPVVYSSSYASTYQTAYNIYKAAVSDKAAHENVINTNIDKDLNKIININDYRTPEGDNLS